MKTRPVLLACLAFGLVPLSGCMNDGYGGGVAVGWSSYPYYGWYDGYYGSIYDGYWGLDNFFYFRLSPSDRHFRRGDGTHFRRQMAQPNPRYQRFEGTLRPPPQGTRMPRFQPPANSPPRGDRNDRRGDRRDRRGN